MRQTFFSDKNSIKLFKNISILHNDLRNYANIEDKNKPLIVAAILLALNSNSFDELFSNSSKTDGENLIEAVKNSLNRVKVVKKVEFLKQFSFLKDNKKLNEINDSLKLTPLRYFANFLYENIVKTANKNCSQDYLGRFYDEFMSYSSDGQNLGIILTPKHIAELFCDLLDLKATDKVLDPTCGTAGFLIASLHKMLEKSTINNFDRVKNQLFGIEEQAYMFSIAKTNMILKNMQSCNLENSDFLKLNPKDIKEKKACNIGMMNPPYSMGSKQNPKLYEINFVKHLLDSIIDGGKVAVIVPQSSFSGRSKEEASLKKEILENHTLNGVITLNKNSFYGVGTNPCIAIFTASIPHDFNKECKFINFEDDGYEVAKHIGLVETNLAQSKKRYLLDVWFDKLEASEDFCIKTTINHSDDWLYSYFYFCKDIPKEDDFSKTISDYMTFEVNMLTNNRGYLFGIEDE